MTTRPEPEVWHVEKKVPVALIAVVLAQTFAIAWWGSAMTTRVELLERQATISAAQGERIVRLEEKISGIQQGISEIKAMIRPSVAPAHPTTNPG